MYTKYGIYILSLFNAGHDLMLGRLESFILRGLISLISKVTESQYQYTEYSPFGGLSPSCIVSMYKKQDTLSLLSMIYT